MKRKMFLFGLVVVFVFTCAIPVSAYSVSMSRYWGDFYYATNDTANIRSFHCVIESDSADHKICTNVEVWTGNIRQMTSYGAQNYMISTTGSPLSYAYSYILCKHLIDGNCASTEKVYPS